MGELGQRGDRPRGAAPLGRAHCSRAASRQAAQRRCKGPLGASPRGRAARCVRLPAAARCPLRRCVARAARRQWAARPAPNRPGSGLPGGRAIDPGPRGPRGARRPAAIAVAHLIRLGGHELLLGRHRRAHDAGASARGLRPLLLGGGRGPGALVQDLHLGWLLRAGGCLRRRRWCRAIKWRQLRPRGRLDLPGRARNRRRPPGCRLVSPPPAPRAPPGANWAVPGPFSGRAPGAAGGRTRRRPPPGRDARWARRPRRPPAPAGRAAARARCPGPALRPGHLQARAGRALGTG
jgi:hypothetical protein